MKTIETETNKIDFDFLNWLMSNCELAEDLSNWTYRGKDYTNEKLYEIFKKNRNNDNR